MSLTDQHPLASPHTNTVSCAGGELGPAAKLTVLLAGQLAGLRKRWHGSGELKTSFDVSLSTILLPARDSWRGGRKRNSNERKTMNNN